MATPTASVAKWRIWGRARAGLRPALGSHRCRRRMRPAAGTRRIPIDTTVARTIAVSVVGESWGADEGVPRINGGGRAGGGSIVRGEGRGGASDSGVLGGGDASSGVTSGGGTVSGASGSVDGGVIGSIEHGVRGGKGSCGDGSGA